MYNEKYRTVVRIKEGIYMTFIKGNIEKIGFKKLAVILVIFTLLSGSIFMASASASSEEFSKKTYKSIEIEKGDTLWGIAKEYCNSNYISIDEYIDELMDINALSTDNINWGNYLIVTCYE
jgi:cell division protein YceG involved in septum cleavage